MITDVSENSKKPTLYATALVAHLLTDEEMKDGSVEPKESTKKNSSGPSKSKLIKSKYLVYFTVSL